MIRILWHIITSGYGHMIEATYIREDKHYYCSCGFDKPAVVGARK